MSHAQINLLDEMIVDNFAGGGGASTGIELATGRVVDVAINHDPDAILMHRTNHFLTRGCPRGCAFCHVKGKEGAASVQVAELGEFWNGQRNIELMDPNILACKDRERLLEQLAASGAYVNFNQRLDIRLMTERVAGLIGDMRVKRVHFAWDNPADDLRPHFERFSRWYRRKDPGGKVVYVLTNFGSTLEEDLYRIYTLRELGFDPYVMIYNKKSAPQETRYLQRWCNNRLIFKSEPDFNKYDPKRG